MKSLKLRDASGTSSEIVISVASITALQSIEANTTLVFCAGLAQPFKVEGDLNTILYKITEVELE